MNLYIRNFSLDIMGDDLKLVFEAYGYVKSVKVIRDKFTGESRGFAFVDMPHLQEARAAILGITDVKGKSVIVCEARPQSENGHSSFRGRHGGKSSGSKTKRY